MTAIYFMCNTAHPTFNGAVNTAGVAHAANSPWAALSVAYSPDGTRAVIKVYRGAPGLINVPTVIRTYIDSEHDQLKVDMALIAPLHEWSNNV